LFFGYNVFNYNGGKTMKVITNAFSLNMVADEEGTARWRTATSSEVEQWKNNPEAISAVGHPDTAKVMGVSFNRISLSLKSGDLVLVGQYKGPRLPEGATTLPEGATIQWMIVDII
jgi:hypothetical protein